MLRNIISNHIHGTSLLRLYGSFKNDVTQRGWSLCEEFDKGGTGVKKLQMCVTSFMNAALVALQAQSTTTTNVLAYKVLT